MKLRIASYNIHGGGLGGGIDPARILAVLRELEADVIALQEVTASPDHEAAAGNLGRESLLHFLAAGVDCASIAGPTLLRADGDYGNALLTRLPVRETRRIDLSVPGREPRGALVTRLGSDGADFIVAVTHLGLLPGERRIQVRRLLEHLPLEGSKPCVLMGDINEWFLWGRPLRWLHAHFGRPRAPATFPALLPLLALDRIWAHPARLLRNVRAHDTPRARRASDHLPIRAELDGL